MKMFQNFALEIKVYFGASPNRRSHSFLNAFVPVNWRLDTINGLTVTFSESQSPLTWISPTLFEHNEKLSHEMRIGIKIWQDLRHF